MCKKGIIVRLIYISFFIDLLIPDSQLNSHRKIHGSKTLLVWSSLIHRPVHCWPMPFITVATTDREHTHTHAHTHTHQIRKVQMWASKESKRNKTTKTQAQRQCLTDFVSSGESHQIHYSTRASLSIQFDPLKFNFTQTPSPSHRLNAIVINSLSLSIYLSFTHTFLYNWKPFVN